MIQEINPYVFDNNYKICTPDSNSVYITVKKRQLLSKIENDIAVLPSYKEFGLVEGRYLFSIDNVSFFMTEKEFDGYQYLNSNQFRKCLNRELVFGLITAVSLASWYQNNKYCGCCGKEMVAGEKERMMQCPECGNLVYPKICPVAIVGIIHNDKLLLTKYADKGHYRHYALVAGFSEFGESIEDTVRREVKEETGLSIKNIKYYASQPWAMSDSLIFGFYCEVDGSTQITFTDHELDTAVWASRDEIPDDDNFSVTYRLMGDFKKYGRKVLEK